jgi:hypothetical protein
MKATTTLARIRRAVSPREWTVKLVPYNGGTPLIVKKIVGYSPDLAMKDAAKANPGYIGVSARATKVLK